MGVEEIIAEVLRFLSEEKKRWTEHRDRQILMGNCWEAYNGRIWMLNHIQGKVSGIIRKHRRQVKRIEKEQHETNHQIKRTAEES